MGTVLVNFEINYVEIEMSSWTCPVFHYYVYNSCSKNEYTPYWASGGGQRQEKFEFKVSLGYIVRHCVKTKQSKKPQG